MFDVLLHADPKSIDLDLISAFFAARGVKMFWWLLVNRSSHDLASEETKQ